MYADQPDYREYQRMLVELHAMIAAGDGDSDRAMELRERMEGPEARLSESEMSRLNALSGDLSMIHDHEIPDPEVVNRFRAGNIPLLIATAHRLKDWEKLLELLRTDVSSSLKPDQLAYMRSRAYEALNEMAPAIAFMDEAARRDPKNVNYRALAMEWLWKDRQFHEAYTRAKEYLADPATPDRLVLMAGGILSRLAQVSYPPKDLSVTVRSALDRIERAIPKEASSAIRSDARASVGLLAIYINDEARGANALQAVLDDTDDIGHIQSRGMLVRELELVRAGQAKTPEARTLSRELADVFVPIRFLLAA